MRRLSIVGGRARRLVRWWFGLTYLVTGVGVVVAGPVMIGLGNYGGVYMIVGGTTIAALGWLVHPWGYERARRASLMAAPRQ